jgi:hypothetical protein
MAAVRRDRAPRCKEKKKKKKIKERKKSSDSSQQWLILSRISPLALPTCGLVFVSTGLATVVTVGNIGSSWARRVLGTKESERARAHAKRWEGGVDAPGSVRSRFPGAKLPQV